MKPRSNVEKFTRFNWYDTLSWLVVSPAHKRWLKKICNRSIRRRVKTKLKEKKTCQTLDAT